MSRFHNFGKRHEKFRPPFQRWQFPKTASLVALRTGRNPFSPKKAQEGRRNSPVDCFGVGNPRRGFPESHCLRDFVLIFQPGICNSRNEPIPVLQRKDFFHYLRETDTGLKKKRLPHTAYAIRCARGTSVRCTAARARNLQFKKPVDTGLARKRLLHTTYARSIPALQRKDYRTLPTRFGVAGATAIRRASARAAH